MFSEYWCRRGRGVLSCAKDWRVFKAEARSDFLLMGLCLLSCMSLAELATLQSLRELPLCSLSGCRRHGTGQLPEVVG